MIKLLLGLTLFIVLIGGFIFFNSQNRGREKTNQTQTRFENPKKSAHYESNTPAHGAMLAAPPVNVVIDFNFDLAKGSEITAGPWCEPGANCQAVSYEDGGTIIDENKLSMRTKLIPDISDGKYQVGYKACWPDGSCHDGHFQFVIDRSQVKTYEDLTGQNEVKVSLSGIKFMPINIKVSRGTKITWLNDDEVEHYVNTDPHPAHTYYREQNSNVLKKGDTYSLTFNMPGVYPYHCSAHADSMSGSIVVE